MTRETKIGLLVGLAFIIVIGILLSDHMTHSTEPPPAPISTVGPSVRAGTAVAANPAPQDLVVKPGPVSPAAPVPTAAELNRPAPTAVVTIAAPAAPTANPLVSQYPNDLQPAAAPAAPTSAAPASAARSYKAAPGDSLSRMASRFYGADTSANRAIIVRANPSLADDPDLIIAGKSYVIPAAASSAAAAPAAYSAPAANPAPAAATAQRLYVVKSGDTLWGIASQQLGSGAAASAIAQLNKDLLKGSTTIRQGMQLRLPPTVND